jgi:hypothetical protein
MTDFVEIEVPVRATIAITAICFQTWPFWAECAVDSVNATNGYKLWVMTGLSSVHQPLPLEQRSCNRSVACVQSAGWFSEYY